jgi:protoporphyrinogen IX oxidase
MLAWLKALHIVAVIAWMAGLLYLPRLLVYHCEAERGSKQSETFKVMEQRLLRLIMNPAMVVVWVSGPLLAWQGGMYRDAWLLTKLILVIALTGYHHALARWRKDFAADANRHTQRFYRIANEVPTLLLIAIVVLVVVKPW